MISCENCKYFCFKEGKERNEAYCCYYCQYIITVMQKQLCNWTIDEKKGM